jgi:hypothetical protein
MRGSKKPANQGGVASPQQKMPIFGLANGFSLPSPQSSV